jgi:phosphate starvation-inducible membrane PsiE
MFRTFRRSWELTKISWSILQKDKELLSFPLLSMIGVLVISLVFALPLLGSGLLQAMAGEGEGNFFAYIVGIVMLFLYYFAISIVVTYSNAALTGAVFMRFDGKDPTVSDGFAIANNHLGAIVTFAALNATVGVISALIRDAGRESKNIVVSILAGIVSSLVEAAWAIVTFLTVPVMVREGKGAIEAVKRSGQLVRDTWGRQIVGSGGISAVFLLVAFLAFILIGLPLLALAAASGSTFVLVIAVLVIVALLGFIGLVAGALESIYRVALYHYAHDQKVAFFEEEVLRGAFVPNPSAS